MGTQKVSRLVLLTGLPLMLSLLINSLYNTVDRIFVAKLGEEAMAALTLAGPVQLIASSLGLGNAVGLNAVISRALGEKRPDRVRKAADAAIFLAVCAWLLICAVCFFGAEWYFSGQVAGIADEAKRKLIHDYGMDYLTVCLYFSLGQMMQWVFDRFVIASGKSRLFLFTLSAASVTNLILDPVFIWVLEMGTRGAAIATVIGQFVGAVAGILINRRWNREIPFGFSLKPDGRSIREILKVGLPSTLVQCLTSFVSMAMNGILMAFNATVVAVYGVATSLGGLTTVGVHGIDNGLIPIVAYNYGARKKERIYGALDSAMTYSVLFFVPFLLVLLAWPQGVLRLFSQEGAGMRIGVSALRVLSVAWLTSIPSLVIAAALQGLSQGTRSMTLTMLRQAILPLALAWALSRTGRLTLVWAAFVLAELISLPYALWLWKRSSGRVLDFAETQKP